MTQKIVLVARDLDEADYKAKRQGWAAEEWKYICDREQLLGLRAETIDVNIIVHWDIPIIDLQIRGFHL